MIGEPKMVVDRMLAVAIGEHAGELSHILYDGLPLAVSGQLCMDCPYYILDYNY